MTSASESSGVESTSRLADSMECLLVVGGYDHNAKVLDAVVAEARKRILASPSLADFFEVRFVGIGPRPKSSGSQLGTVTRLMHELAHPRDGAARYYFAFAIIDKSAAAIARTLRDCTSDSVISGLPIRFRGVATVDDRRPGGDTPGAAEIVLPEAEKWNTSELVTQIERYAETLMADFVSGQDPGLHREQLEELQRASEARQAPAERETDAPRADNKDARRGERRPAPGDDPEPRQPRPLVPAEPDARERQTRSSAARQEESLWQSVAAGVLFPVRAVTRLGSARRDATLTPHTADSAQLVLLVLVSQPGKQGKPARDRAQTVFRRVERSLAVSGARWVHTLWAADSAKPEQLRPAGRRAKEASDSGPGGLDFASAVEVAKAVMARDVAALEGSSWTVGSSAVIFYTEDVPLADPRTVHMFGDIIDAPHACVAWVVPKGSADLIAPQLRRGVRVIETHRRVANEITSFLLGLATRI